MPHQYPTIEVPSTCFHLVGTAVRVPTTAAMVAYVATWVDENVPLGPFVDETPETEVARPRNIQLIPGYYAALLMHRRGVSPKVAFQVIHGAMQARNEVAMCGDILTWLKAACTARGGGGLQNGVPIVYHPLMAVHLPAPVYLHATNKVKADLPALASSNAESEGMTSTLAGALRALTKAAGGSGADGEDGGTREPKAIQEVYRETYQTLLRYCNVQQPSEVAPVWKRLANCSKSERQTIITQEFQRVCNERGLSTEIYVPIVTTNLKQMILGFQFVGHHGVDDLSTGCQPFLVTYSGGAHHIEALAVASLGNQLAQGDHNANLADIRTIREKERLRFPADINHTGITIYRYAVLCQTLFQGPGEPNTFVEAVWKFAHNMQNAAPFIVEKYLQVQAPSVASVYFPCVVRTMKVIVHEFLQQVEVNAQANYDGLELPDFRDLLSDLRRGTFQHTMMSISAGYLTTPRSSVGGGGTARSSSATSVTGSLTGASVTGTSGVSALTDSTRQVVARVENPNPDPEFRSITVRPGGFRSVLNERRPPSNDQNQEFCVAWCLRGACFPNCGRRATHVPFASATERMRLLNFCREHLAAPAEGGT